MGLYITSGKSTEVRDSIALLSKMIVINSSPHEVFIYTAVVPGVLDEDDS